jgi:hypothetical protein
VADDRGEEPTVRLEQPIIRSTQREHDLTIQPRGRIDDDDFGFVPFVLPPHEEDQPTPFFDNEPPPAPPDETDLVQVMPTFSKARGLVKIDDAPLIPIIQISAYLDDKTEPVPRTHSMTTHVRAQEFKKNPPDFVNLFDQAKEMARPQPRIEIRSLVEDEVLEDGSMPLPPGDDFERPEMPDEFHEEPREEIAERETDATFDLFPLVSAHLEQGRTVRFSDLVAQGRREMARLFFSALCLPNRGILRLTQKSWQDDILIAHDQRQPSMMA